MHKIVNQIANVQSNLGNIEFSLISYRRDMEQLEQAQSNMNGYLEELDNVAVDFMNAWNEVNSAISNLLKE